MTTKDVRQFLREIGLRGWTSEFRGSGHIALSMGGTTVFMPSTPSDQRSMQNVRAKVRRAERALPLAHTTTEAINKGD